MSDLESQFCHVALAIFNLFSINFFIFYYTPGVSEEW